MTRSTKRNKKHNIKLLDIKKSPIKGKKLRATFVLPNGKYKHTDFGASGMSDYTKHHDQDRRQRYISRHTKDLNTNDPMRAGYLSMYILWNKLTIRASIADYKRRLLKYNQTGVFKKQIGKSMKSRRKSRNKR